MTNNKMTGDHIGHMTTDYIIMTKLTYDHRSYVHLTTVIQKFLYDLVIVQHCNI